MGDQETNIRDITDKIIEYEAGLLPEDEEVAFFQELIDSGMLRCLQGHYHRTAQYLVDEGLCNYPSGNYPGKVIE